MQEQYKDISKRAEFNGVSDRYLAACAKTQIAYMKLAGTLKAGSKSTIEIYRAYDLVKDSEYEFECVDE